MVKVKGVQKTSMIDYPGKMCSILFTPGCNFRCPFCYNKDLVLNHESLPEIPQNEILEFLKSRINWIDGVCITGGEPLMFSDISELLKNIKKLGLKIKLDTNGTNPELLKSLIKDKLIDYVAMDIKNSLKKYDLITDSKVDPEKIKESVNIILSSGIEHEFRTTTLRKFHADEDFKEIALIVKGAKNYYLQNFKPAPGLIDKNLTEKESFSKKELESFKKILETHVDNVVIRNV